MSIPFALADVIEKALIAVENNPDGNLNLGYRQAIWAKFGARLDLDVPESKLAHKKRTILAIQAVKRSLFLWEEKYPEDKTPYQIIDQIEKVLQGIIAFDTEEGLTQYDEFWCYFDNKSSGDPAAAESFQISIGYAAALCFYVAFIDENFDENYIDVNLEDAEDPYEMDVAQIVSIAYADGGVGDPNSNKLKRKEFWQWWLTEAVPQAWNMEIL
jgi:hypothetical protein